MVPGPRDDAGREGPLPGRSEGSLPLGPHSAAVAGGLFPRWYNVDTTAMPSQPNGLAGEGLSGELEGDAGFAGTCCWDCRLQA